MRVLRTPFDECMSKFPVFGGKIWGINLPFLVAEALGVLWEKTGESLGWNSRGEEGCWDQVLAPPGPYAVMEGGMPSYTTQHLPLPVMKLLLRHLSLGALCWQYWRKTFEDRKIKMQPFSLACKLHIKLRRKKLQAIRRKDNLFSPQSYLYIYHWCFNEIYSI